MEQTYETTLETSEPSRLFYPPGGLLVWLFVLIELFTFGIAFVVFSWQMMEAPAAYVEGQRLLNLPLATLNTIVLLTSGMLAALGVIAFKKQDLRSAANKLSAAGWVGSIFVVLKFWEYWEKYSAGLTPSHSNFFSYYWTLTGFHLLHVIFGILILFWFSSKIKKGESDFEPDTGVETGVVFWHMCDLIWIVLFPLIYLAH